MVDTASKRQVVKNGLGRRVWKNRYGYLFLLPIFAIMGIFKYYPTVLAIFRSFFDWNGFNIAAFTGLKNYRDLFTDQVFWAAMRNVGIICAAGLAKVYVFPLLASELVFNMRGRFQSACKYLFVIPMVVPAMVVNLMWKWIYNPTFGVLNQLLKVLGVDMMNHAWLGSSDTALGALIGIGFPWIGGTAFLILLGGLQAIPVDLFESSKIDGINVWQRLRYIDLPLIFGQLRLLAITTVIDCLGSFESVLVLTGGGPGNYTMVPALHMYQQGMTYYRMGYACAIGMAIFLVVFAFTLLSFRLRGSGQ